MSNGNSLNYSLMSLTLEISNCLLNSKKHKTDFTQTICNKLVSQYPYRMAWIGVIESDGSIYIKSKSGESEIESWRESMNWNVTIHPDNPFLNCIFMQAPVCLNIQSAHESFGRKWSNFLIDTHSNSLLIQPFFANTQCIGFLCIHSNLIKSFTNQIENALLAMIVQYLSCHYETENRKNYDNHLNYEQKLLPLILDNITEGVFLTDPQGIITYANGTLSQMTGRTTNELIGQTPTVFQSNIHTQCFYSYMLNKALKVGRWQEKLCIKHKDGYIYPQTLTLLPLYNRQQEILNYIGILSNFGSQNQCAQQFLLLNTDQSRTRLFNFTKPREKIMFSTKDF